MAEEYLGMGAILQLTMEKERLLKECLDNMIKREKMRASSSTVGSLILFVLKPNRKKLKLCEDFWHLD